MKSEIFWPLLVMLMLTAITVFGLLPLAAAPLPKVEMPVVRLGQPYRAELRRTRPAPTFLYYGGVYLSWRNSARFDALHKPDALRKGKH